MASVCVPDGNRGLPIILQGPVSQTQINSMKTPSFIELKPTQRTTYPSIEDNFIFNENSGTTIRISGETFSLQYVQIFKVFNNSTYYSPKVPLAEMTIWYKSSKSILLTVIPIFTAAQNNLGGKYLAAAFEKDTAFTGSIEDLYGNMSLNYETCIQYGSDTVPIQGLSVNVFVFLEGIEIDSDTAKSFYTYQTVTNKQTGKTVTEAKSKLHSFGFPAQLLPDMDLQTVQRPSKGPPDLDESKGNLRTVYSSLVSTGSDIFTSRFRYYEKTFIKSALEQKKKDASAYKCIPIDTKKNMKMIAGKLVVDLNDNDVENAESLEDIVNEQKAENEQTDVSDAATYVAIAIGTVTGAAIASGLLWMGFRLILRKSS